MTFDQAIRRIRRALMLEEAAFVEARDDPAFTLFAGGAAALAVFIAAIGAYLYGQVVLSYTPDGFLVDTLLFGSILLLVLWAIGVIAVYLILVQLYGEEITTDGLARVLLLGHIPFAVSLLVFLPEIGFGFGILAIAAMFFYSMFGMRAAYPRIDPLRVMFAVLGGFFVWAAILPILDQHRECVGAGDVHLRLDLGRG